MRVGQGSRASHRIHFGYCLGHRGTKAIIDAVRHVHVVIDRGWAVRGINRQGRYCEDLCRRQQRNVCGRGGKAQGAHHWYRGDRECSERVTTVGAIPTIPFSGDQERTPKKEAHNVCFRMYR